MLVYEIKTTPLQKEEVRLLTANSVYSFSEMYFSYDLNFTTNKKQFFE